MIVIAIIAVIAAIMTPSILGAVRAANERSASATLQRITSSELMFRTADADGNFQNDYWTGDVANLYFASPVDPPEAGSLVALVELPVAKADGNPLADYATPGRDPVGSEAKAGYWFFALSGYESGSEVIPYGASNANRFGFIAVPDSYRFTGRLAFIVSQLSVIYKRDPGGESEFFAEKPAPGQGKGKGKGKGKAKGLLKTAYSIFPAAKDLWTKLD